MINQRSLQEVEKGYFKESLCRPRYDSYCFSKIPATIRYLLTGREKNKALPEDVFDASHGPHDIVILVFLDGFGWRFFDHYRERFEFLQRFVHDGISSKITSQFPSTTAAHVTCINTGLEVAESGVYEWFYYEPKLDRIIAPLLSSFAGDKEIATLGKAGIDVATLYPKQTIYQQFQEEGIQSFVHQPIGIAHSPYSEAMCKGALFKPYHHLNEALDNIVDLVRSTPDGEKRYFCLYFGDIDGVGHRHGLFSKEYEEVVAETLSQLNTRLYSKVRSMGKNASIIVTADHGMTDIHPKETFYVNLELPELVPMLKKTEQGIPIAPAGSCRDFFLHVEEAHLRAVELKLKEALGKRAWVVKTSDLIQEGFFGKSPPSKEFLSRVGNLVVLPFGNESIWWYEKGRFEQKFLAMHGGLSQEEMETIFLFARMA